MSGKKILVIDDEEIIITAFKKELGREGYKVDGASSGEKAVKLVKAKKYDLIFVDFVLPGIDGVQTCREIKKISPEAALVFMTGNIDKKLNYTETDFAEAGGRIYYLYKPFINDEILDVVNKALKEKELL